MKNSPNTASIFQKLFTHRRPAYTIRTTVESMFENSYYNVEPDSLDPNKIGALLQNAEVNLPAAWIQTVLEHPDEFKSDFIATVKTHIYINEAEKAQFMHDICTKTKYDQFYDLKKNDLEVFLFEIISIEWGLE